MSEADDFVTCSMCNYPPHCKIRGVCNARPKAPPPADDLVLASVECENVAHGFPECCVVAIMREERDVAMRNEERGPLKAGRRNIQPRPMASASS